jgi:hypothetical protein
MSSYLNQILSLIRNSIQSGNLEEQTYDTISTKLGQLSARGSRKLRQIVTNEYQKFKSGIFIWSSNSNFRLKLLDETRSMSLEQVEKELICLTHLDYFNGQKR